ncbi:MAG TPA: PIN domain-containing protein [Thermomicrobiaceae bacterium]|nr:PIN domain-containing protein [Thermomicrobiaceae bacterium]
MSDRRSRAQRTRTPLGRALRYVGLLVGIVIGWGIGSSWHPSPIEQVPLGFPLFLAALLGALLFLVTPYITLGIFHWLHQEIRRLSAIDIIAVAVALVIGGVISALLAWPLSLLPNVSGKLLPALGALAICSVSVVAFLTKKRELQALLIRREPNSEIPAAFAPILLDTSAIIDGRIADLAGSGFLPGDLVVPQFVLRELQLVADSSDLSRRERGHRGLDILDRLKRDASERLQIVELDVLDEPDVDSKLLRLAQRNGFRILTGDRNLERVATLQAVRVLNIHHLANILRPPIVPGEEMDLKIIQPGREFDQGVGYLTDGTMVVVESGKNLIGQDVKVIVTRTLQTGAGRMAFAHVVGKETA